VVRAAGKRQSQKAATREQILEAARRVCLLQGLFPPTDEIAREASVAHGTIFVHFPTREELQLRVLERLAGEMGGRLHELAASKRSIEELLHAHIAVLEEYKPFYKRLLEGLAALPEGARMLLLALQSVLSAHLGAVIEEGQRAGRIKSLPLPLLFNAWIGLVHHYLLNAALFAPGESVLKCRKKELIEGYLALITSEK
jgi:AcrR family transcriptional regulator